jgi:hypothetical protein
MTLIKITDHVDAAKGRLVQQYKESVRFNDLIESLVLPVQEIEDQTDNLYRLRSITTSEGLQLDRIGDMVGELRFGRDDQEYRSAILTRVAINVSGGEPESIITAIRQLLNPLTIDYVDTFPASFQIFIQVDEFIPNLASLIRPLSPAGIGSGILLEGGLNSPFVFSEISSDTFDFIMQSGSFNGEEVTNLELVFTIGNNYNLEIESESTIDDFTGDGFAEVYLTTAILLIDGDHYNIGDGDLLSLDLSDANEDYTISTFGGELVEVVT